MKVGSDACAHRPAPGTFDKKADIPTIEAEVEVAGRSVWRHSSVRQLASFLLALQFELSRLDMTRRRAPRQSSMHVAKAAEQRGKALKGGNASAALPRGQFAISDFVGPFADRIAPLLQIRSGGSGPECNPHLIIRGRVDDFLSLMAAHALVWIGGRADLMLGWLV